MKRLLLLLMLAPVATAQNVQPVTVHAEFVRVIPPHVRAQAGTLVSVPPGSIPAVQLTWQLPTTCTGASPCGFEIYQCSGSSCDPKLPVWTAITGIAQNAMSYLATAVSAGQTYSYVVETLQGGQTSVPSNVAVAAASNPPPAPVVSATAGSGN